MADNTILNTGVGGDTIRDKDRAGVKTQIVALDLNPSGSETLMSGTMPTSISGSVTIVPSGTQTVSGTVTANQGTSPWIIAGGNVSIAGTVTTSISGSVTTVPSGTQTVSGTVTANQGTSPWIVSGGAVSIAGTTAVSIQGTVTTSGGLPGTPYLKSGITNTAVSIVNSAATLLDYYVYNPNTASTYLQIYDSATSGAVTVGTTLPKWSIGIPATGAANLSGINLSFASGIQVAATTSVSNSTAAAVPIDANFGYR